MDHGSFPRACLYCILFLWARWLKSHYAPRTSLKNVKDLKVKSIKLTLRTSVTPLCDTFSEVSHSIMRHCTSYEVHGDISNCIGMDGWKTLNWNTYDNNVISCVFISFHFNFQIRRSGFKFTDVIDFNTSHEWLGRGIAYVQEAK